MSKIAFIFPGQGAQACGMGQDFYEQTETGKRIFDKATELMGFSMPQRDSALESTAPWQLPES